MGATNEKKKCTLFIKVICKTISFNNFLEKFIFFHKKSDNGNDLAKLKTTTNLNPSL